MSGGGGSDVYDCMVSGALISVNACILGSIGCTIGGSFAFVLY